ncbi:MAG TPA: hypothetical protein PK867_18815 [Pirellulales bacterium]|nr:hypothetical protein [Pirellulales bacterium]
MIQAIHADAADRCAATTSDSCQTPRLDEPTGEWTLWQLYDRALWENAQIGQRRRCAPSYWYFGTAMRFVQGQVPGGAWKAWCIEHKIQANRWKRGRHLALAFDSAADVADMTIEAADALACEILGIAKRSSTADTKFRRWLTAMEKALKKRLDEFDCMTRPDGVLVRIAELKRQLTQIEHRCAALEKRQTAPIPKRRKKPR